MSHPVEDERETFPEIRVAPDGSLRFPTVEPQSGIRPGLFRPPPELGWARGYTQARTTAWGALRNVIAVRLARLAAWIAP